LPIWYAKLASSGTGRLSHALSLQGDIVQRLRLWSGLVLVAYAATHLANHSVGLLSLADMEAVRQYFVGFWRSWPGTIALAGSMLVHLSLVVAKLIRGKTWRLPRWQWAQIALGLTIPWALSEHLLATRLGHEVYGYEDSYTFVIAVGWPSHIWPMVWLIGAVWIHGCIGVHFWGRLYPWYRRLRPWLLAIAVLLPALGFAGYTSAGKEIAAKRAADKFWTGDMLRAANFPGRKVIDFVKSGKESADLALVSLVVVLVGARLVRMIQAKRDKIVLSYPQGQRLAVLRGTTVLEASRQFGIPHAAVCGGRGRCSTCRIRVGAGGEHLPLPSESEQRVLRRVSAPPGVRLACQVEVTGPLEVTPLLPPASSPAAGTSDRAEGHGTERELVVLFSDIRAFTNFAEHRLPYDVVFVLNQYFKAMSEQVEAQGGFVDKFIGDGLMALFGLNTDRDTACRQAVAAVKGMSEQLQILNRDLENELREPLRIGVGLHVGPVIVGRIGHGGAANLTAIGDTVNVASRLEPLSKEFKAEAVISHEVAIAAGLDVTGHQTAELPLRGRSQPLQAVVITKGSDL
jgi:adenylate cyclase